MSCLLGCEAALTPYLPQQQNFCMPFRSIFFMVLFNDFFKYIYLDSFIRPFFSYAPAVEMTVFTYRFGAPVRIFSLVILKVFPLKFRSSPFLFCPFRRIEVYIDIDPSSLPTQAAFVQLLHIDPVLPGTHL